MSKAPIAAAIRDVTGCTVVQSNEAATAAFTAMKRKLNETGVLQVAGFGTFRVVTRRQRWGTNPRTGTRITIRASKTVAFKSSRFLRDTL
jgi:DNA-binding protein HU-beta